MSRDPRFDPLFEPMRIGPVTAPNRFYQVPHCSGMGYLRPHSLAAMRAVKAEGGWGVVCTEYCSIDDSADETPYPSASLRDDDDVANLRLMTEAVHAQGALAGIELWYGGHASANLLSRRLALDVASLPNDATLGLPQQSRAMSRADIAEFRELHRAAARRALDAGFDIVYVYGCHGYLLHNFLDPYVNRRDDEYGGPLANRVRLLREVIEDTAEIVRDRAALAVRYAVPVNFDEDPAGLVAAFESIAELPDLWDITVDDYNQEMGSARFVGEAAQQSVVKQIRSRTSKPIVSVGRFTSPDTMLRQLTSGTQDFIGAARPSIADPYLPQKIEQGRFGEIRECIGCNVCYAHNSLGAPIRCTQNPTMGEEWRRGWHPERIEPRHADETVLVVGAGPAGLEAARALGQRGYSVMLAEASRQLGGRINREARLPGLETYARVRDWRLAQLEKMPNVQIYPDNRLDAEAVLELECRHLLIATGARWRKDGVGLTSNSAFQGNDAASVIDVEQVLDGYLPEGHVVIYDDDHYYLGSAIALKFRAEGIGVTLVSPENTPCRWTRFTDEHEPLMRAMIEAGVEIVTDRRLLSYAGGSVNLACVYSGKPDHIAADFLLPIGTRVPDDRLWLELQARHERFTANGGLSMQNLGDCRAPGIVAAAIFAGHLAARELGSGKTDVKRDRVVVAR